VEEVIRADFSPSYRWRPGAFALVSLVMAGWFFYDGFYSYPRENAIAQAFHEY